MIDSVQTLIHLARKQPDGSWRFEQLSDPNGMLTITTIGFNLSLSEIYFGAEI